MPGSEGRPFDPTEEAEPQVALAGQVVVVAPSPVEVEPLQIRAGKGIRRVDHDEVEPVVRFNTLQKQCYKKEIKNTE